MSKTSPSYLSSAGTNSPAQTHAARPVSIVALGMALGGLLSISFVLCVLFDLWFPQYAMNPSWAPFLPGFVWINWASFFLGLVETFAYGWYVALIFAPLYNYFATRCKTA